MRLSILAVGVALIAGYLTGGRLARLSRLPLRYGWVAVVALLFRASVVSSLFRESSLASWSPHLQLLAFITLVIVGLLNWRVAGFPVLILGLISNATVMLANGGYMPVDLEAARQAGYTELVQTLAAGNNVVYYTALTGRTLLPYLGDTIVSPPLPTQRFVYSAGDIIAVAGLFLILICALHNVSLDEDPNSIDNHTLTAQ